jgi:uncharacterized protein
MFVSLFFLIALLAEVVGTIGGFGSSVFFVPLAGLFFDFHTAAWKLLVCHRRSYGFLVRCNGML